MTRASVHSIGERNIVKAMGKMLSSTAIGMD
jgi:hypothetical protein